MGMSRLLRLVLMPWTRDGKRNKIGGSIQLATWIVVTASLLWEISMIPLLITITAFTIFAVADYIHDHRELRRCEANLRYGELAIAVHNGTYDINQLPPHEQEEVRILLCHAKLKAIYGG